MAILVRKVSSINPHAWETALPSMWISRFRLGVGQETPFISLLAGATADILLLCMLRVSRKYFAATIYFAILLGLWLMFFAPATLPLPFARSPISGNHKFVFFNPFRNRDPERAAQRFFEVIKSGTCGDFSALASGATLPNNATCEELHEIVSGPRYKGVLDQRLRDRVDCGNSSSLWFSDDGYGGNQVILEER